MRRRDPLNRTHHLVAASLLLLPLLPTITAKPFNFVISNADSENATLVRRCANPCGYYGQVCCNDGEQCYTDSNNQAQCGGGGGGQPSNNGGGGGYWQYFTSTFVETDLATKTTVYSSFMGHPTQPAESTETAAPVSCDYSSGESSCGNICCPQGQYCQVAGQCAGGAASAPLRPTSSGNAVVTQTSFSTTTTVPFQTPIATGQMQGITATSADNSSGLSGGAIAGIVIGVIAGIILLLLLCLFFCFKAAWDALFGRGRRRRNSRRETVVTEEYHHRGSGRGGRGTTWYGGSRPSRVDRSSRSNKKGWGTAAGLGGIATALGFRRKEDRRRREMEKRSDYSSSYGEYSDYTGTESRF